MSLEVKDVIFFIDIPGNLWWSQGQRQTNANDSKDSLEVKTTRSLIGGEIPEIWESAKFSPKHRTIFIFKKVLLSFSNLTSSSVLQQYLPFVNLNLALCLNSRRASYLRVKWTWIMITRVGFEFDAGTLFASLIFCTIFMF
jgi:hypothetical protein